MIATLPSLRTVTVAGPVESSGSTPKSMMKFDGSSTTRMPPVPEPSSVTVSVCVPLPLPPPLPLAVTVMFAVLPPCDCGVNETSNVIDEPAPSGHPCVHVKS